MRALQWGFGGLLLSAGLWGCFPTDEGTTRHVDGVLEIDPKIEPNPGGTSTSKPRPKKPTVKLPGARAGSWDVASGKLTLAGDGTLTLSSGEETSQWATGVSGKPSISAQGARVVVTSRSGGSSKVQAHLWDDGVWATHPLVSGAGMPRLATVSPDGSWVGFVSNSSGVPSVWAVPFRGGSAKQLTNKGIKKVPEPSKWKSSGYEAAPTSRLGFSGEWLSWEAEDGYHQVKYR